ncbi:acetyl-CoA acetyltransferase [Desarmillaria tabescens]|uniref:acetyl-CoA C-acetyltransferase n=1 Tax=Armillaria tabescens TaxID=1929756 RepID=A0AA39U0Q2_ARMTA|nr:acetyl-CoA acetyltransferase [Desarmillaria tabescens]KAK0468299.1 acetyl-CoA acetyltransferase [Desarmillaria tabescens]
MFTRPQFDLACRVLAEKYVHTVSSPATTPLKGWSWNEHASINGLGYLSRRTMHTRRLTSVYSDNDEIYNEEYEEQQDESTAVAIPDVTLICQQYIVYSATFQVPAFYFTMHDCNGSPLGLADIMNTSLFRPSVFDTAERTTFALSTPDQMFPLLSQGDHPTLGTPSWYFHPCESARAVDELMTELGKAELTTEGRLVRWIEMWIMVVGSVLTGSTKCLHGWCSVRDRLLPRLLVPPIFCANLSYDPRYGDVVSDTETYDQCLGHPSLLPVLSSIPSLPTLAQWYVPSSSSSTSTLTFQQTIEAVIVAAARTPTGSINGSLKTFTAPQLGAEALKHALASKNIDPALVEEVYFGNVVQAGVGQSPARQAALNAGLSKSSDATTINKVCASGMKSVILAAQSIMIGDRSIVAAGGMESMSNAPFLHPRHNPAFGKYTAIDSLELDGLWDVFNNQAMGNCGESAAVKLDISRESQDQHAIESYQRATRAWKEGAFDAEIVPLTVKGKKGDTIVREDEEYKRVIYEKVPSLKSAFKQGGSITAANSSPLNDGASALILMSAEKAKELGLQPLAKIISYADAGVDPIDFPIAPTVALPKALEKANLTVKDISLFEINEAFSVVVRIAEKVLGIDPSKINVNGGAVALGHAIGSSGSRIIVSLVHALKSGEYGAAGVCNGGGAASAIVIQKL